MLNVKLRAKNFTETSLWYKILRVPRQVCTKYTNRITIYDEIVQKLGQDVNRKINVISVIETANEKLKQAEVI